MNGVEDVAPTLYHEALGHLGLRERFREGLDAVLEDIYRTNKGVAALDFARKYLGLDLKFSDREVRTILAMAHEQALSGEGTVMGSSSMMFKTPEQNEADEKVADADVAAQDTIENRRHNQR